MDYAFGPVAYTWLVHNRRAVSTAIGAWPFRGRDEELDVIHAAIGPGGLGSVVVLGQAGVGKTRLLREVASSAERVPAG